MARRIMKLKQFERWRKILKKHDYDLTILKKKYGFYRLKGRHVGIGGDKYASKKYGLIIKEMYICNRLLPRHYKIIPPTQLLCGFWVSSYEDEFALVVQSLCQIPKYIADKRIVLERLLDEHPDIDDYYDIHEYNVGLYRGHPVMIDW